MTIKTKPKNTTTVKKNYDNYPEDTEKNDIKNDVRSAMKGNKNTFSSDNLGIRAGLNALGFDNNAIGWDGENVTYNDKPAFVPDRNDNGTTKINTAGFIKGVNKLYGSSGNYLSDITSYAANSGISNLVEYGNEGNVSVGGVPVQNAVIIDGQAYASTNDIKKAVDAAKSYSGILSPTDVYEKNYGEQGRYSNSIDKLVNKLVNRRDFKYDPEKDPAYLAYKDMYMRNGMEAHDNTYGEMAARTGGYGNSAAIAAAGNTYYSYMNALNDKIPELYKDAYERYTQRYNDDIKLLEKLGTPKDIYGYQYDANSQMRKDINDAMNANYERNINSRDYNAQRDDAFFERNHKTSTLEQERIQNEAENAINWDKNAIGWEQNAIDWDKNAIGWDQNAIGWDKNAIGWDSNQINRDKNYIQMEQNRNENALAEREIEIKEDENERENKLLYHEIEKLKAEVYKLKYR